MTVPAQVATTMTRLVIVDDHAIIRQGLRTMLEREHELVVVAEAGTGLEAREAVREHRPDVVLLDLKLGEDDDAGLDLIVAAVRRLD